MKDAQAVIFGALLDVGIADIPETSAQKLAAYLDLLVRWNARLNLTSVRQPEAIIARHFVESIFAGQHLPAGTRTLLDYGSGGGFPGLPIAMTRPEIGVTLGEAHAKKASFLREVIRTTGINCAVYGGRVEDLPAGEMFDVVTMRAVEAMEKAIPIAATRAKNHLMLLVTERSAAGYQALTPGWFWLPPVRLPKSEQMVVLIASRR